MRKNGTLRVISNGEETKYENIHLNEILIFKDSCKLKIQQIKLFDTALRENGGINLEIDLFVRDNLEDLFIASKDLTL